MGYRGQKFLVCPDCKKKGVQLKLAPRGEDGYHCHFCQFWAYTMGTYPSDVDGMSRLKKANPEQASIL